MCVSLVLAHFSLLGNQDVCSLRLRQTCSNVAAPSFYPQTLPGLLPSSHGRAIIICRLFQPLFPDISPGPWLLLLQLCGPGLLLTKGLRLPKAAWPFLSLFALSGVWKSWLDQEPRGGAPLSPAPPPPAPFSTWPLASPLDPHGSCQPQPSLSKCAQPLLSIDAFSSGYFCQTVLQQHHKLSNCTHFVQGSRQVIA